MLDRQLWAVNGKWFARLVMVTSAAAVLVMIRGLLFSLPNLLISKTTVQNVNRSTRNMLFWHVFPCAAGGCCLS